jgi:hypothetical protein
MALDEEHLYLTMETRREVTLSRPEEDLIITGDADYFFPNFSHCCRKDLVYEGPCHGFRWQT